MKKLFSIILTLSLVTTLMLTFSACSDKLHKCPCGTLYKYGYIDFNGNIIIEPNFYMPYELLGGLDIGFYYGHAMFFENNKYGFIDTTGAVIAEAVYDRVHTFHGDFAWVSLGGKWGRIDTSGNYITEPAFDGIRFPHEEIIGVQIDGKWGYADQAGNIIIEPAFDNILEFVNGYAFINMGQATTTSGTTTTYHSGFWGAININGKIVTEPWLNTNLNLWNVTEELRTEGLAAVNSGEGLKYYFINNKCELIMMGEGGNAHVARRFSEGLATTGVQRNNVWEYYYIDKEGNIVIDRAFQWAAPFRNGLALVSEKRNEDFAVINMNGDVVFEIFCEYFHAYINFSEGLRRTRQNGKYGFIDTNGEVVIPFIYSHVTDFKDGMARADRVIIDRQGNVILELPEGYNFLDYERNGYSEGLIAVVCRSYS
jgi:hypothetical protein